MPAEDESALDEFEVTRCQEWILQPNDSVESIQRFYLKMNCTVRRLSHDPTRLVDLREVRVSYNPDTSEAHDDSGSSSQYLTIMHEAIWETKLLDLPD